MVLSHVHAACPAGLLDRAFYARGAQALFPKPVSTGFGLKALAVISKFTSTLKRADN